MTLSDHPLVSVLIPTYNRPKYLFDALQSVFRQTYDNIEIIICDNSSEATTEIEIKPLLEQFTNANVKYVHNETNIGPMNNMQKCLELSSGEYISYLMDDDLIHPEKIEKIATLFATHPEVALVTSSREFIDSNGAVVGTGKTLASYTQIGTDLRGEAKLIGGELLSNLMLTHLANIVGEPSTAVVRRKDLGGRFGYYQNRQYAFVADMATWLSVLKKGSCIYIMQPLSSFRIHTGQAQRDQSFRPTVVQEFDWLIKDSVSSGLLPTELLYNNAVINFLKTSIVDIIAPIVLSERANLLTPYHLDKCLHYYIDALLGTKLDQHIN